MIKVSPSLLSSDLLDLRSALKNLYEAGADYAHVDCMDGHFVNNMAFGPSFVSALKKENLLPLDVHLMIDNPLKFIDLYLNAASIVTIHVETIDEKDFFDIEKRVHSKKKLLGISFRPNTSVATLEKYLPYVDVVLIMSVMPGFSGQKFMDVAYAHLDFLNDYRQKKHLNYLLEVDGGVDENIYPTLINKKADIIVSGKYLFDDINMMKSKIQKMKNIGN